MSIYIHEYLIFNSRELIVSSIYTHIGHTHLHNFSLEHLLIIVS